MHEAVLEDRLGDAGDAIGARHQRHELRLKIGRKVREGRRADIDGRKPRAVANDAQSRVGFRHLGAGQGHRVERRPQEACARPREQHVAARHGDGHRIGAGLDPVGQHRVPGAVQRRNALDLDRGLPRARDARAHRVQAVGEIDDLGLARRVAQHGRSLGERSRHQRHMRAADGDFRKVDLGADEALLGARHDIAVLDRDLGAELLHRHEQEIDGARADRAAAWQRDARLAHTREQRREHPEARAHARDHLIGRGRVDDLARREMHGAAGVRARRRRACPQWRSRRRGW